MVLSRKPPRCHENKEGKGHTHIHKRRSSTPLQIQHTLKNTHISTKGYLHNQFIVHVRRSSGTVILHFSHKQHKFSREIIHGSLISNVAWRHTRVSQPKMAASSLITRRVVKILKNTTITYLKSTYMANKYTYATRLLWISRTRKRRGHYVKEILGRHISGWCGRVHRRFVVVAVEPRAVTAIVAEPGWRVHVVEAERALASTSGARARRWRVAVDTILHYQG